MTGEDCGWVEGGTSPRKAAVLAGSCSVWFPVEKAAWWHGCRSLCICLWRSGSSMMDEDPIAPVVHK